jgi:drug/metabolite transporter (DMT)-like permease
LPIFSALLGVVFLGERLRPIGWVGIITAFAGAGLIAAGKDESFHVDLGALLVLLAAGVWSLYFVGQKRLLVKYNALDLMICVIWAGTLVLLYFAPAAASALRSASIEATASVVYLGTFPTIVAHVAWAHLLSQMPVFVAASALYTTPVIAMLLAWLILAESPTITMVTAS